MAFGAGTFSAAGGAVSDIFAGQATKAGAYAQAKGLRLKAYGDRAEATNYDLAATLADQNEKFTEASTAIKQAQQERQFMMAQGTTEADIAGAGFTNSGSALDILRDGASQGALAHAVLGQQGRITELGYHEQGVAYRNMSTAANYAAGVEDMMAGDAEKQGNRAERNSWITGGLKAAGAVASVFAAPATGGLSLAALRTLASTDPGDI